MEEQDLLRSGGFGRSSNSARAGFIPIALDRVPVAALKGIPVFVKTRPEDEGAPGEAPAHPSKPESWFRLYRAADVRFTEAHRQRLMDNGVRFVYLRMTDQSKFRRQTEENLKDTVTDRALAISERSALVYETGVQLVNELLAEPELLLRSPRLEQVSRAITTLVMNHPNAFSHLLAASHHDFYTATHMVNVATWMVPLAFEMGIHDPDELNRLCQAGLLHDIGKITVPESVLNKPGALNTAEWDQLRRHPVAGVEYLQRFGGVHPTVLAVTRQHHERLDGSGYPDGLRGDQIDMASRICAVVDSFDAMTAFRPFKDKTLPVEQALRILQDETPRKYDEAVMKAWMRLIDTADAHAVLEAKCPQATTAEGTTAASKLALPQPTDLSRALNRRVHERHAFHCPARMHILEQTDHGLVERPGVPIVAHSLSRGGLGILSRFRVTPGEHVRVYLLAAGWLQRPLNGVAVRCRTHSDLWHELGVQFTDTNIQAPAAAA